MLEPAKIRIAPPAPPYFVWAISCDAIGYYQIVQAASHEEAVSELVRRGFKRLLNSDCPYQDEPLVLEDDQGRVWDAMPAHIPLVRKMRENLREALSSMTGGPLLAESARGLE